MRNRIQYAEDDQVFNADAYKVEGYKGIAWYVLGWEIEQREIEFKDDCARCKGIGEIESEENGSDPCPDCDGRGNYFYYEMEDCQTDRVVCRMIGDDRYFTFDHDEITPLERVEYCSECGQIGCTHDGYDREEA